MLLSRTLKPDLGIMYTKNILHKFTHIKFFICSFNRKKTISDHINNT